jgi:hypothetical protein
MISRSYCNLYVAGRRVPRSAHGRVRRRGGPPWHAHGLCSGLRPYILSMGHQSSSLGGGGPQGCIIFCASGEWGKGVSEMPKTVGAMAHTPPTKEQKTHLQHLKFHPPNRFVLGDGDILRE